MPTFTADPAPGVATASALQIPVATPVVATPAGQPTLYELVSVDYTGGSVVAYPTAVPGSLVETLNGWEELDFTIPLDVDTTEIPLPNPATTPPREVQLYRNGTLLFWGLPTTRRVDSAARVWRYTARGFLWVLSRRNIGKANRTDFLGGVGNFEGTDLADFWSPVGSGLTVTADTTIKLLDDKSAKLVTTASGAPRYIQRSFVASAGAIGLALFLTAWVYVESMVTPPVNNWGAWIGIGTDPVGTGRFAVAEIDSGQVTNGWRRLSAVISLLPNETNLVSTQLYAAGEGTVYWDAVTNTALESFSMIGANSPGGTGWDQVRIAQEIVRDLQGVSGFFSTTSGEHNGKSDLHIAVSGDPSGIVKERTYQHADHIRGYGGGQASGGAALDDFARASDGFDFRINVTPTTRTFRTYYPTVGDTIADVVFTWRRVVAGDGTLDYQTEGIGSWTYDESVLSAANDIVELSGWGTGAGREEGGYRNAASLGGLTLELVEGAPNGTPIDLLDGVAEARGAQLETPLTTPTFEVIEPRDPITLEVLVPLIGRLRPGDVLTFDVEDGGLSFDGDYRIARTSLNCGTDVLSITPNPEPL